jgi:hypothetical protein
MSMFIFLLDERLKGKTEGSASDTLSSAGDWNKYCEWIKRELQTKPYESIKRETQTTL